MALHSTTCPLDCGDACVALVDSGENGEFKRLGGNPVRSYTAGALCGNTAIYSERITGRERLDTPLVRNAQGEFESASLEHPIDIIVQRVKPLASAFPENVGLNALTSPEVSDIGDGNVLYSTRVDLSTTG